MHEKLVLPLFIEHNKKGTYLKLPFTVPEHVEGLALNYQYDRHPKGKCEVERGSFVSQQEANVIDLGLIAPDGTQVGASGSDKKDIFISESFSTPGYRSCPLIPGQWQIIVGAYKIAPEGVTVTYTLSFTYKKMRLLKGDLHTHTLASDGVLSAEELARRAQRHGLDFLAITDHNQLLSYDALPQVPGITLIPGVEWTHYQGHANFLGVDKPYDTPYIDDTPDKVKARFQLARERGALITVNHPYEGGCEFKFDLAELPFDCLEVWNGPMRMHNFMAVGFWQSQLSAGKKIPICGGSDYHRDAPFFFPGGPTTCVFALSSSPTDILEALKAGRSYVIFAPDGPSLQLTAGNAIIGDTVPWPEVQELKISVEGLREGDNVRVITDRESVTILEAPSAGSYQATYVMKDPGFARIEIGRNFLPGIPELPALLSNPIYFDKQ